MSEEVIWNMPIPEPQNRSGTALAIFLIFSCCTAICLFIYNFITWSMQQSAIISLSAKDFAWAGNLWPRLTSRSGSALSPDYYGALPMMTASSLSMPVFLAHR